MFDIYTEKLGHMESIPYNLFATREEKPFEHIDPSTHDVFLISNSLHFTLQEAQQLLKKMALTPEPFEIYKVLHYKVQERITAGFSYLEEDLNNASSSSITSSLFLVAAKEDSRVVQSVFEELGFISAYVSAKYLKDIVVLNAFDTTAFTVDGVEVE